LGGKLRINHDFKHNEYPWTITRKTSKWTGSLIPYLRYYGSISERWQWFLGVQAGYQLDFERNTFTVNLDSMAWIGDTPDFFEKRAIHYFKWGNHIGTQFRVNPQLSIESSLYYDYFQYRWAKDVDERFLPDYRRFFPNFVFNPTIKARFSLTQSEETPFLAQNYLQRGTWTVGGSLHLNQPTTQLLPSVGYFVAKGLLVNTNWWLFPSLTFTYCRPELSYYIPATQRTQIVLQTAQEFQFNLKTFRVRPERFDMGMGLSYFIGQGINVQGIYNLAVANKDHLQPNFRVSFQYFVK
jgi:hypothetical protein